MRSFMYTIKVPMGMHARHAGLLVRQAERYQSRITVSMGEKSADGKRILGLMGLGVKRGDIIRIVAEGVDEDAAAAGLKAFLWENL